MKIPFNIKYKSQIESGEYEVVTAQGSLAKIISWDADEDKPIIALITNKSNGYKYAEAYDIKGVHNEGDSPHNLSIITRDPELTEFEKAYSIMRYGSETTAFFKEEQINQIKKDAATLLEYARRQFDANKEHQSSANTTYQEIDNINVREKMTLPNDMFKEFYPPIWKKIKDDRFYEDFTIDEYDNGRMVICKDNYEINIEDLWNKLTKED